MNAALLPEAPVAWTAPEASPPLSVSPALRRFCSAVRSRLLRELETDEGRQARRRAVLDLLQTVAGSPDVDTIASFELVLNGCLDLGYRTEPLAAFVFDVLQRRLAGRIRRRLAACGHDPDCEEVSDLVATSALTIQQLLRSANREQHSLRYALLLSIADHRTIDYLRRRRPEYRATMDDRPAEGGDEWPRATDGGDPERRLQRAQRQALALSLRDAVLEAVNSLPRIERAALILVEVEGMGYPEVADHLGIKRTDVGNVVRRARLRRDRALVPLLRGIPGLENHVGFSEMQDHRDLRLSMLAWTAEIGDGVDVASPEQGWLLTPRAA